ncbi:PiggyBac transposable element-derived protein 4 [Elysia marginata]|uniref:PiggyBac transposable element-derived protein 4 n=1 Tax=Elysia marginata TaxID=1093978 RepID=A0AAV4EBE6_9GAST|nr:PiggyBac transposable element-derived protein 4 [Elysia marginata]
MGIQPRPAFRDYWALKPSYKHTPWYHAAMKRERFEAIHSTMLHCSATEAESVQKIAPFMNSLLKNFQAAFYPWQNLSLDEMVIGWKGRFKYRQFNAAKPKKFHIKMFGLCNSTTGYTYNLLGYFGSERAYDPESDPDGESAIRVFQTLLTPLIKGHHIFADRYYTTRNLVDYLLCRHVYYTFTVQSNRRGFPAEMKTLKLNNREKKYFMNETSEALVIMWRNKKAKTPCLMVSTNTNW